jgi:hypothetical protein
MLMDCSIWIFTFSGVLAKGKINPHFTHLVARLPGGGPLLERISKCSPEQIRNPV